MCRETINNLNVHYPIFYVCFPSQRHISEVKQFDIPIVIAGTNNTFLLVISIAWKSSYNILELGVYLQQSEMLPQLWGLLEPAMVVEISGALCLKKADFQRFFFSE